MTNNQTRYRRLSFPALLLLLGATAVGLGQPGQPGQPGPGPGQPATPARRWLTFPVPVNPPALAATTQSKLECIVTAGPPAPISAVAFSADGKSLFAGGYQEVLVWDLVEGRLAKRIGQGELSDCVRAMALRKGGKQLAVGEGRPGQSSTVKIFDLDSGSVTASLDGPLDVICGLAFSPDGKLLAAGSVDNSAYLWNVDEKRFLATLQEHGGCVQGVSWSPDGKSLATAGGDKSVLVWELEAASAGPIPLAASTRPDANSTARPATMPAAQSSAWKVKARFPQPEAVSAAVFSPDGTQLAIAFGGQNDHAVRVVWLDSRQPPRTVDTGPGLPQALVWDSSPVPPGPPGPPGQPPASRIFIAGSDRVVRCSEMGLRANPRQTVFNGHSDWVYCLATSPDGLPGLPGRVAAGGADGTVRLWESASGKLLATFVQLSARTDDWAVVTPAGFAATSLPKAALAVNWKATALTTQPDNAALRQMFTKPAVVKDILAGKTVPTPAIK